MKQVYSDVIQFRGSHYEFGFMQGEWLKNTPILKNRKKQWGSKSYKFLIDNGIVEEMFLTFAPKILDELHGLADALKINTDEAIREFGGFYLEYGRSGCSIITGSKYMVRNYDNDPISYEGRYVFFQPTDYGYATVGPSMQITGRTDGLNEKGLAMGYNFVNRKKGNDGFVCNMIGRIVLETCATIDEAIDLLKEIPHRHSFSYVLLDKSGRSIVAEASPRRVETHEGNFCANHFEQLLEENRYQMEDSLRRVKVMEEKQTNIFDGYKAFRLMNDTTEGVFSKKYGAWAGTIHTAAYFPEEMKAWFALGGDRMPLVIDFGKWLHGENTQIKRVKGELDSKSPFVNMEEI